LDATNGRVTLPDIKGTYTKGSQVFAGWSKALGSGMIYPPGTFPPADEPALTTRTTAMYAVWVNEAPGAHAELRFHWGGSYDGQQATDTVRIPPNMGTKLPGAERTREGFNMLGWSVNSHTAAVDYQPGANFEGRASGAADFYAVWESTGARFTITFDSNGGNGPANNTLQYLISDNVATLHDGTGFNRNYRQLKGWSTSPTLTAEGTDGIGGFYDLGSSSYAGRSTITLYAVWHQPQVELSFEANFSDNPTYEGSGSPPTTLSLGWGDSYTFSDDDHSLTMSEHAFRGWKLVPTAPNPLGGVGHIHSVGHPQNYAATETLYAHWALTSEPNVDLVAASSRVVRNGSTTFTATLSGGGITAAGVEFSSVGGGAIEGIQVNGLTIAGTLRVGDSDMGQGYNSLDRDSEGTIYIRATLTEDLTKTWEIPIRIYGARTVGEWKEVRIGQDNTMAITWDGRLYAWGRNQHGQLGLGYDNPDHVTAPEQVGGSTDWLEVNGGLNHSLGIRGASLTTGGTLWAWGQGANGKLGTGNTSGMHNPTQVGTLTDWVYVAAGDENSYGIRSNGELYAWGIATYGRVGDGQSTTNRTAPVQVGSADQIADAAWQFKSVSSAYQHTVAIRQDGTLWTWGRNDRGQLGPNGGAINDNASQNTPVEVLHPEGKEWISASAGREFTVALDADGVAWTWGSGDSGRLGREDISDGTHNTPGKVDGERKWRSVTAGHHMVLAIDFDEGWLFTWGQDTKGQASGLVNVNDSTLPSRLEPTRFAPLAGANTNNEDLSEQRWISVNGGGWYSLAVREDGQLWGWGDNAYGQIGSKDVPATERPTTPLGRVMMNN